MDYPFCNNCDSAEHVKSKLSLIIHLENWPLGLVFFGFILSYGELLSLDRATSLIFGLFGAFLGMIELQSGAVCEGCQRLIVSEQSEQGK